MNDIPRKRTIRSFVKRTGRITPLQRQRFNQYHSKYCIVRSANTLNFAELFKNNNPVWCEIGFGMGHSLLAMAEARPDINFLAIEVHEPGVVRVVNECEKNNISNIKIIQHDAVDIVENMLTEKSLARVLIFFPDPWHKTRHHKRRLVQTEFMTTLITRLNTGGIVHCATDWEDYALHMMQVLSDMPALSNVFGPGHYAGLRHERPQTKFERRGEKLGHSIFDLIFSKN